MYIPVPYFKAIPRLGNLTLDYIFIKDKYPLLFTCVGENGLYLCLCFDDRIEQKWVIAPIDLDGLRRLINNEISIRSALKPNLDGCLVTWSPDQKCENYSIVSCRSFADEDLPDEDVFLDDEDSIVYYNLVMNRIAQKVMLNNERNLSAQSIQDSSLRKLSLHTLDVRKNLSFEKQGNYGVSSTNLISRDGSCKWNFGAIGCMQSKDDQESGSIEQMRLLTTAA